MAAKYNKNERERDRERERERKCKSNMIQQHRKQTNKTSSLILK
jgi:hypothetical protein